MFATDTFSVFDWLHANAALNWMQAQVQTSDQLGTALNGKDVYARANPSAGFTFKPLDAFSLDTPLKELTTYFNYNEGFRAPTAVELSCANPACPVHLAQRLCFRSAVAGRGFPYPGSGRARQIQSGAQMEFRTVPDPQHQRHSVPE